MQAIWAKLKESIPLRNRLRRPIDWFRRRWHSNLLDGMNSRATELGKRLDLLQRESEALKGQCNRQEQAIDNLAKQHIRHLETETVRVLEQMQHHHDALLALLDERAAQLQRETASLSAGLSQQQATLDKLLNEAVTGALAGSGKFVLPSSSHALRPRSSIAQGDSRMTGSADVPAEDEMQKLDRQGLFVIGSGRSGTTIFVNCINLSKEVCVLEEPDLFVNFEQKDFVRFFNARHRSYDNLFRKGAYIPPSPYGDDDAFSFLCRMNRRYRYVGEKLAIAPQPNAYGEGWQPKCLDFYSRYFYGSTYFLTMRAPAEVIWSMKKKFPDRTMVALFECWLLSVDFQIDIYLAFENTYVTFFDWFSPEMMNNAAGILGISVDIPAGMIADRYKKSAVATGEMPAFLRPHADFLQQLHALYELLRESFCPRTFRYLREEHSGKFFERIKPRIAELLEETRARYGAKKEAA